MMISTATLTTARSTSNPGKTYQLVKRLAGGGQGEVFLARSADQEVALKLYHAHLGGGTNQDSMLRAMMQRNMASTPEGRRFVWPQDVVKVPEWGRWGYVMPLVDRRRFLDLGELQARGKSVVMSHRRLAEACYHLSSSLRHLHAACLCYRDISRNNILFDPATGELCIIDNDNVGVAGDTQCSVEGTPEYMAPEIITGRASPSTLTDLHSLAVLLFEIWTWHHPFHGDLECAVHCWDMHAKQRVYGDQAVFIFDPENPSNRPSDPDYRSVHRAWKMMPPTLRELFIKAFTAGLREPARRVTEGQWQQAFLQLFDGHLRCACGAENLWDPKTVQLECWNCRRKLEIPPRLRVDTSGAPYYLLLTPGVQLLGHHLKPSGGRQEPPELLGEVVQNPANPSQWGLQNRTGQLWTLQQSGGSVQTVPPNRSAPLIRGAKITILNRTCTIDS